MRLVNPAILNTTASAPAYGLSLIHILPLEIAGLADRFIDIVDLVADDHLILIVAPLGTKHGWQLVDRFRLHLVFILSLIHIL